MTFYLLLDAVLSSLLLLKSDTNRQLFLPPMEEDVPILIRRIIVESTENAQDVSRRNYASTVLRRRETRRLDAVLIGDSWVDSVWSNTKMWPEVMCGLKNWAFLNVGVAGTCVADCHVQLEAIKSQLEELQLETDHETLWIIHSGGNDLLYGLLECHPQIVLDVIRLHLSRCLGWNNQWLLKGENTSKWLTYFPIGAQNVALETLGLLREIKRSFNAQKFLVASNTTSSAMPLCKYCSYFVTPIRGSAILDGIALILSHRLVAVLKSFEKEQQGSVRVTFFDEQAACVASSERMTWAKDAFHPGDQGNMILSRSALGALEGLEPIEAVAARKLDKVQFQGRLRDPMSVICGVIEAFCAVSLTVLVSIPVCALSGIAWLCGIEKLAGDADVKQASRRGIPNYSLKGWRRLELSTNGETIFPG